MKYFRHSGYFISFVFFLKLFPWALPNSILSDFSDLGFLYLRKTYSWESLDPDSDLFSVSFISVTPWNLSMTFLNYSCGNS